MSRILKFVSCFVLTLCSCITQNELILELANSFKFQVLYMVIQVLVLYIIHVLRTGMHVYNIHQVQLVAFSSSYYPTARN